MSKLSCDNSNFRSTVLLSNNPEWEEGRPKVCNTCELDLSNKQSYRCQDCFDMYCVACRVDLEKYYSHEGMYSCRKCMQTDEKALRLHETLVDPVTAQRRLVTKATEIRSFKRVRSVKRSSEANQIQKLASVVSDLVKTTCKLAKKVSSKQFKRRK